MSDYIVYNLEAYTPDEIREAYAEMTDDTVFSDWSYEALIDLLRRNRRIIQESKVVTSASIGDVHLWAEIT